MLASNGDITDPCPVPLSLASSRPVLENARLQPFLDQAEDALVADTMLDEPDEPFLAHRVEGSRHRLPIAMMFRIVRR